MKYFALVVLCTLSACGGAPFLAAAPTLTPVPTCADYLPDFLDQVQPIVDEWSDVNTLAGSTSRIGLPPQVQRMQEIRRRVSGLEIDDCLQNARKMLVLSMDSTIDGYIAFMGQKPDSAVSANFEVAESALRGFRSALAELRAPATVIPSP